MQIKNDRYIKEMLEELIDALEEKYGEIEGFECKIEHLTDIGNTKSIGYLREFSISHLVKNKINIEDLK